MGKVPPWRSGDNHVEADIHAGAYA
jgi:hypothetical protein